MSSKIALFIDAENISHTKLSDILTEVPRHGQLVLRAIYGDWQNPTLQNWHEVAEKNKFKIRHQPNPSKTKNSSDIKLVMDAMEVLYTVSMIDIFCIVTSDADFVSLCHKLRDSNKQVIGIGYQNAAESLIRACDKFIFIRRPEVPAEPIKSFIDDNPPVQQTAIKVPTSLPTPPSEKPAIPLLVKAPEKAPIALSKAPLSSAPEAHRELTPTDQMAIWELLLKAFAKAPQEGDKWVSLGVLYFALDQIAPGFQTGHYGYPTLTQLLQSMPDFVELGFTPSGIVGSARLKHANPVQRPMQEKSPPQSTPVAATPKATNGTTVTPSKNTSSSQSGTVTPKATNGTTATPSKNTSSSQSTSRDKLKKLLREAFAVSENDNGWVSLTALGQALSKIQKGFKTSTYGHSTLTKLLQNMPDFVELRGKAGSNSARLRK